jgi:hypothetical protein
MTNPSGGSNDRSRLEAVRGALGALNGPAETAFLAIGTALGQASEQVGRMRSCFAQLVERLADTEATAARLREATARISLLAGQGNESAELLAQLGEELGEIDGCLESMSRVVREVGALAVNAKIQASFVQSSGMDFTVFTTEIQTLGFRAADAITNTRSRLRALDQAIADALAEERDFEQAAAKELIRVDKRLEEGLVILVEQHRAAALAVDKVQRVSEATAQHIVSCMIELQFNDTASQRIEHVRDAMVILDELFDAEAEEPSGGLVGAVCRLQALQLERTGSEYGERVETLRANLQAIAGDALTILTDADAAIGAKRQGGGDGGAPSFIGALEDDIALAAKLLHGQAAGRQRVKAIVGLVSTGFAEVGADINTLQSIDDNMRMMGLNATFKCARLGDAGLALGIVADALRMASERMRGLSAQVAERLQHAIARSQVLGTQEEEDIAVFSDLEASMSTSMVGLGTLATALDEALATLHRDGDQVASLLTRTADGAKIHHLVGGVLAQAAQTLSEIADASGVDGADIAAMGDRIKTMLAGHYTMQSERLTHQIFADFR